MKIVTKLYIFSFSIITIVALVLFLAAYQQKRIISEMEQVIERDIEISTGLSRLTTNHLRHSVRLERMAFHVLEDRFFPSLNIFSEDVAGYTDDVNHQFDNLVNQIQSSLDAGISQVKDKTVQQEFSYLREELDKIMGLHTQYIDISNKLFNHIREGRIEDIVLYQTAFQSLEDELNHTVELTLFQIQKYTAASASKIKHLESRVLILFTVAGGLVLGVISCFLFIIIRRITNSIDQAVLFAEDIEAGRRQLPEGNRSKDEIGHIIHAMEIMLQSIKQAEDELKRLALTDSLTGIANRLNFNTTLDKEIERSRRYKQPLSLIMFDIDHFKLYNDTYGHDAGDLVLKELAEVVSQNIRSSDLFARWGGEEFMVLLANISIREATTLAEKIRFTIEQHSFSGNRRVTSSFGVCQFDNEDADTFLNRVDIALYQSKDSGRNCVTVAAS